MRFLVAQSRQQLVALNETLESRIKERTRALAQAPAFRDQETRTGISLPRYAVEFDGPFALAGDWAAWAQAWQALDAGPLASALQTPHLALVLCGERNAVQWTPAPPPRG